MAGVKGRSGTNKGKDKPWSDALRLAALTMDGDRSRLRKIAEQCVSAAMGGDIQAIREIGDRLDGKPAQAIEHSGEMTFRATELSDNELASIAIRGSEGTAPETVDPSQFN